MGWIWYKAKHYKNGKVDRKKEMDSYFNEHLTLLKSSMVGSVYYAAVKVNTTEEVFGFVASTATKARDVYNFGYKDLDETCGPYQSKCPVSILNLLTPTDSQWANEWRQRCRDYAKAKADERRSPNIFSKLPIGTKVIWTVPCDNPFCLNEGEKLELEKAKSFGRVRSYWLCRAQCLRIYPKHVNARDYEVVKDEVCECQA